MHNYIHLYNIWLVNYIHLYNIYSIHMYTYKVVFLKIYCECICRYIYHISYIEYLQILNCRSICIWYVSRHGWNHPSAPFFTKAILSEWVRQNVAFLGAITPSHPPKQTWILIKQKGHTNTDARNKTVYARPGGSRGRFVLQFLYFL